MSLLVVMHTEPIFLILYFHEPQIMVCRNYTIFYLALLGLACVLFKIGIYNAGMSTRGRGPIMGHNLDLAIYSNYWPVGNLYIPCL